MRRLYFAAAALLIATAGDAAAGCPLNAQCEVSTDTLACPSHKVAAELVNKSRAVKSFLVEGAERENVVDEIVDKASRSACSVLKAGVAVRVVEEDSGWAANLSCVTSTRGGSRCLWVDAQDLERP